MGVEHRESPSTVHRPSLSVKRRRGGPGYTQDNSRTGIKRHRSPGEPGHTRGTHGRTRAHGRHRRTSQPSKPANTPSRPRATTESAAGSTTAQQSPKPRAYRVARALFLHGRLISEASLQVFQRGWGRIRRVIHCHALLTGQIGDEPRAMRRSRPLPGRLPKYPHRSAGSHSLQHFTQAPGASQQCGGYTVP